MTTLFDGGSFDEMLVADVDTKVASWLALLPACKRDPMLMDGTVDEVMWAAHTSAAM